MDTFDSKVNTAADQLEHDIDDAWNDIEALANRNLWHWRNLRAMGLHDAIDVFTSEPAVSLRPLFNQEAKRVTLVAWADEAVNSETIRERLSRQIVALRQQNITVLMAEIDRQMYSNTYATIIYQRS